jgi:hypothetical protein
MKGTCKGDDTIWLPVCYNRLCVHLSLPNSLSELEVVFILFLLSFPPEAVCLGLEGALRRILLRATASRGTEDLSQNNLLYHFQRRQPSVLFREFYIQFLF